MKVKNEHGSSTRPILYPLFEFFFVLCLLSLRPVPGFGFLALFFFSGSRTSPSSFSLLSSGLPVDFGVSAAESSADRFWPLAFEALMAAFAFSLASCSLSLEFMSALSAWSRD